MSGVFSKRVLSCIGALGSIATFLATVGTVGFSTTTFRPAWAQAAPSVSFDDAEAQLRVRQAATAASDAAREVEDLRKALDAERKRIVQTSEERDLNRETIGTLEKNLRDAETKLRDRDATLNAAREARTRGLAAEAERQKIEGARRPSPEIFAPQLGGAADRRKPEEDAKKAAEASETALRLSTADRQHIQVALAALGFNPNGIDGVFGTRSRDMIAAWQRSHSQSPTGFLTGAQNQALLKEAAPAIAKYDDEQKKAEEARRKAEEETKARTAAATAAAPAPGPIAPAVSANAFDGDYTWTWTPILFAPQSTYVRVVNGYGTGTFTWPVCGATNFRMTIGPYGDVNVDVDGFVLLCLKASFRLTSRMHNNRAKLRKIGLDATFDIDLVRRGS